MSGTSPGKLESLRWWGELHSLADGLDPGAANRAQAIEECIEFVLAETKGIGHGRARALMCRRLKHCELTLEQRQRLVACITGRLADGNFSEQFRDQLRLAMHLDPESTFTVAHRLLTAGRKHYIRRFAKWVVDHEGLRKRTRL